jgi:thiazole synthase ThiGH ThiG subunit
MASAQKLICDGLEVVVESEAGLTGTVPTAAASGRQGLLVSVACSAARVIRKVLSPVRLNVASRHLNKLHGRFPLATWADATSVLSGTPRHITFFWSTGYAA